MIPKEYEYVTVRSTRGHFNLCDPAQESVSTTIVIHSEDGKAKTSCNITTDYEIDDPDIDTLISEISSEFKRYCFDTARDKKRGVLKYIEDHADDLYLGNLKHEHAIKTKKRDDLNARIAWIEKVLSGQGYFEKGVWIE